MEDVGGELNAFTTKEETCLHTTFFNNYYDRTFELMADLIFNSVLPEKEIEKEKDVIIDEINSYKDSPVEQLYDDFEELVFNDNPIARNILGNEPALRAYSREDLKDFFHSHYPTTEMVISSVGNIPYSTVLRFFEKYFSPVQKKARSISREIYNMEKYRPGRKNQSHNTYQSHCIIGNQAYNSHNEKRLALHLLNNLLGGTGMNSRLNMALRENNGLAYNVESNYTAYSDVGIVNLYFGTDKTDLQKCLRIIHRELKKLCSVPLGNVQLARAKRQLTGQIAIAWDNNEHQMISNGRSLLIYEKVDTLEEITRKIERITSSDLLEVANEIFDPVQLSSLIYE